MSELLFIPLDQIHSTGNVRMDEELDESFLASIKSLGVLTPITVETNDAGFNLVAGHRRVAAARAAGITQVPAQLIDAGSPQDRIVLQLVENIQRSDLDPIEEALAYQNLANEKLQQKEIADRVGVTQPHISKRLSLLRLSDSIQNKIRNGQLDVNLAVELAKIKDHSVQDRLVKEDAPAHRIEMALRRQREEDELAKFINRVQQNVEFHEAPDLRNHRVFGEYGTLKEYQAADIPEDAVTVAATSYDGKPCFRVYVPTYGNSIVDPAEKDETKIKARAEREASRERDQHLKAIVAKAAAKDTVSLAAAFLFDRLVSYQTARRISVLLDLDPNVGGYVTEERLAPDPTTGEVKTRKSVDYTKLVTDWYSQGAKESVQALMAAIIVGYDGMPQLEAYLVEKGVPTVKELLEAQTQES